MKYFQIDDGRGWWGTCGRGGLRMPLDVRRRVGLHQSVDTATLFEGFRLPGQPCGGTRAERPRINYLSPACVSQWYSRRQNTTFLTASILHRRPFIAASPVASLSASTWAAAPVVVCAATMSSLFERIKSAIPSGGLEIAPYKVLRQGQVRFFKNTYR